MQKKKRVIKIVWTIIVMIMVLSMVMFTIAPGF